MTYDTSVQFNCCIIDSSSSIQQLVYYDRMEKNSSDSACVAANNAPCSNKKVIELYVCVSFIKLGLRFVVYFPTQGCGCENSKIQAREPDQAENKLIKMEMITVEFDADTSS